jgi:hypothetical protein
MRWVGRAYFDVSVYASIPVNIIQGLQCTAHNGSNQHLIKTLAAAAAAAAAAIKSLAAAAATSQEAGDCILRGVRRCQHMLLK